MNSASKTRCTVRGSGAEREPPAGGKAADPGNRNSPGRRPAGPDVVVDLAAQRVEMDGCALRLTWVEWAVIECLAQADGRPVSRDELFEKIRYQEWDGVSRSIDLAVSRLRAKLGDPVDRQHIIRTVRNRGYALVKK